MLGWLQLSQVVVEGKALVRLNIQMEEKRSEYLWFSFGEHPSSSSPSLNPLYVFGKHLSSNSPVLIPRDTFSEHSVSSSLGLCLSHLLEEHWDSISPDVGPLFYQVSILVVVVPTSEPKV